MLSLRDVSELLVMMGIQVSYENIREWGLKFGQMKWSNIPGHFYRLKYNQ
jgi:transposase-like protein